VPILPGYGSGATANITHISAGAVAGTPYITNQGRGYTGHNFKEGTGIGFAIRGGALSFKAITDQTYVRDLYLGSGIRTTDAID
jgi:hypothetical protein